MVLLFVSYALNRGRMHTDNLFIIISFLYYTPSPFSPFSFTLFHIIRTFFTFYPSIIRIILCSLLHILLLLCSPFHLPIHIFTYSYNFMHTISMSKYVILINLILIIVSYYLYNYDTRILYTFYPLIIRVQLFRHFMSNIIILFVTWYPYKKYMFNPYTL